MKKTIVGLMAVGAFVGLRPVMKRMGQKMRVHCEQMAAQAVARGEAVGRT
jgi:hypothetical protein